MRTMTQLRPMMTPSPIEAASMMEPSPIET